MRAHSWMTRTALIAFGLLAMPVPAWADAFPMPAGQGRAIMTLDVSKGPRAYDSNSTVVAIDDFDQVNVYVDAQYGLTDDLTLIVAPSYRSITREGPAPDSSGIGFVELGARYRFATSGSAVFSGQATVRVPGKKYRDPLAMLTTDSTEVDLRGTVGTGLGTNGSAGFAAIEGGYRLRSDDPPNEFRLDATIGVKPLPRLTLIAASYNVWSDGAGRGAFQSYRYHNLYLSGVYDVNDRIALQLGAHGTLAGRNALRERGVFAGVWLRF